MIDTFRRLCGHLPAAALVLDVGCGNGLFSEAMFGQRQIVGVDYSLGMCSRARSRGMRVYHADAMALPFADAQFDLVYSAEIVQYIDDLPAFIAELARVCRPGSAIIISTLNRSSLLRQASGRIKEILLRRSAEPSTTIMRSVQDMLAAAELSHLQLGKVCWSHFPFPWQHFTASRRYRFALLASNLIVEFTKIAR
jgi:ubiquinone/menaquinone biosynthesis C-methylase UbiE